MLLFAFLVSKPRESAVCQNKTVPQTLLHFFELELIIASIEVFNSFC